MLLNFEHLIQDTVVVNKDAVYKLMASHADFDSQLFLAKQIGGLYSLCGD